MFAPLPRESLGQRVHRELRQRILDGRLPVGERLPAERDLAASLGVNRGAVRESLKRLQQSGLVSIRHGGGTQVREWRRHAGIELLPHLLLDGQGQVRAAAVRGLMALRNGLAPTVAERAAARAEAAPPAARDTAPNTDLSTALAALEAAEGAARQPLALAYWSALVDAADDLGLRLAFNTLEQTYGAAQAALATVLRPEYERLDEPRRITAAVLAGDPGAAARAAREYVAFGAAAVEAWPRRYAPPESRA